MDLFDLFAVMFMNLLAAAGLYELVATQRGPYAMFSRLRDWGKVEYDDAGFYSASLTTSEIGKFLMCVHCSGLVYALVLTLMAIRFPVAWMAIVATLGTSYLFRLID